MSTNWTQIVSIHHYSHHYHKEDVTTFWFLSNYFWFGNVFFLSQIDTQNRGTLSTSLRSRYVNCKFCEVLRTFSNLKAPSPKPLVDVRVEWPKQVMYQPSNTLKWKISHESHEQRHVKWNISISFPPEGLEQYLKARRILCRKKSQFMNRVGLLQHLTSQVFW